MQTTQQQILKRIRRRYGGDGAVVTPKDFLDLAGRDAVDQALARLVRNGVLVRVGRGLYHLTRTNKKLGITVPPDADKVADALGRQTGSAVAHSPAVIANRLGLSTQIPANAVYLTSGRSRAVKVGSKTYRLKHASPRKMPAGDSKVGRVLQAINALGSDPKESDLNLLRASLSTKERRELARRARYHSGRVSGIARRIASAPTDAGKGVAHG